MPLFGFIFFSVPLWHFLRISDYFTFSKPSNSMITLSNNNFEFSAKMGSNFFNKEFMDEINLRKEGL